jgi:hypothetical protein
VVGVPNLTWGQKVGAVIVPVAGAQIHINTLRYNRRRIRLIEDNAKSLRLKSDLDRDFAAAVIFLRPPPLLGFFLGVA